MNKILSVCSGMLLAASCMVKAGEVGYVEEFALSDDRAKVLEQLIPGTDDYYYYSCLHHQNEGDFKKVDGLLKQWVARRKGHYTSRAREIANRQALLQYDADPSKAYRYIKNRLRLSFNHQKEQLDKKTDYPTKLDPNEISWQRLRTIHGYDASDYETSAFEVLAREPLKNQWRREVVLFR